MRPPARAPVTPGAPAANAVKKLPTPPAQAVKKRAPEAEAQPEEPAKKMTKSGPMKLSVVNLAKTDELGVETLLGEFVETGTNHGKKCFKRVKGPPGETQEVFLYYWDERDGEDFSGWWFGDQVGGSQVWSRCPRADDLPPRAGWRIPWDGPVRPNLAVRNETPAPPAKPPTTKDEKAAKAEAAAEAAKKKAEESALVQTALDRIVIAEIEATQALESSQAMLDGEVTNDALQVVEEMLQAQQTTMVEAHKVLAADIIEARKTAPGIVEALTKLTPRLRSVQASLAQEMTQAKQLFAKKQLEAKDAKKQAVAKEKLKEAAKRDMESLEDALPGINETVEKAETAVEAAVGASGPLSAQDVEDTVVEAAIASTEEAAVEAQKLIKVAKKAVNGQLADSKQYAGDARKVALQELTALQDRLTEAHKRLVPCIRVRKDFEQKLDARKVMGEVATKLGAVELEVEKVLSSFEKGMPSEAEVKDAEESISPVLTSLANAMRFVDQRIKTAQGVLKEDLEQMQERGKESKAKLDGLRAKLREQQEQTQVLSALQRALELTAAAEEACQKMADVEAPFLKGEEPAPGPEAEKLIDSCTEVATKAEAASQKASAFVKAKQVESSRFPEEVRQTSIDELAQLQLRIEASTQQVETFKRDTSARRTAILVLEVSQKIDATEAKVKQVVSLAANLASDKLEDMAVARLKELSDQTLAAEKIAGVSLAEARQALAAKQKHSEAKDSTASLGAELTKLTARLLAAQQELSQQRKVAVAAERCWKGKRILEEKDEELKKTEAELEKLDIMTTPLGDERTSDETLMEIAAGVETVEKSLEQAVKSLEAAAASAQGIVKAGVTRLLARAKKAEARLEDVKSATVEQRERASVDVILTAAKGKMASLDDGLQKISVAEVPFQGGSISSMQLPEAKSAIADSEAAAIAMQEAVVQARTFLTSKSLEVRKFGEAAQRSGLTEISVLSGKVEEHVKKLQAFRKATATRKRAVLDLEAASLVAEAEEAVQKTILAATPLATHNVDEMASDAAIALVEKLGEAEAEAQKQLNNAKKFVMARQREKRDQSEMDELAKLMGRLSSSQEDLTQAKTTASDHEQKVVSRSLLQTASDMITNLELEMDKAALAAVPLVEQGGKTFIASSRAKLVVEALSDHAADKQIALDALFAELPGGSKGKNAKMTGADFLALLQKLPEICGRPDISFTPDERTSILEQFDVDKDGSVSSTEFLDMFRERFICVVALDMSEGVEAGSVVVGKLESGDVVEALQEPQTVDASGAVRLHVKALKSGASGWVTMQTAQGSTHLGHHTQFSAFMRGLDKTLGTSQEKVSEVNSFINQKNLELKDCKQGPLAKAKLELLALRPKVSVAASKLDQLKKKVDGGRREHSKREEMDRKKLQEKKERKASAVVLKAIAEKVERVNGALEAAEAAAAPLTQAQGSELTGLSTPITVKKAAAVKMAEARAAIEEARECIKIHNNKLTRASFGPWLQAKQEVARQTGALDASAKSVTAVSDKLQAACDALVAQKVSQVASAIRASLHEKGQTISALYSELAGSDGNEIAAKTLDKYLGGLPGVTLPMEQMLMIFDAEGAGGISRLSFSKMLERFCVCVKPIALTAEFDIRSSASVRMLEKSEYLEVIEGPTSDAALGVTRVRARAVKDGKVGWVTVKGNQGTPFLRDTTKPCFYATKSVPIQDTFGVEGANEVGTLRPYDVIEVLEGPEKEVVGSAVRAKVKACSDAAVGWLTVRSKQGVTFAEASKVCYTCVAPIALTDVADIKDCKVLRKLVKGEVLSVLEGPTSDANSSVTRLRGKSLTDDTEGWVTVKGNAGGVYLEQSQKHYIITKAATLQTHFASARATDLRGVEVDEIVEVLDGPKEEATVPTVRLKGRAASTGVVGWVSVNKMLSPWYPRYKSSGTCALREGMQATAPMLRRLEGGEALEVLEGPAAESGEAPLCVRVRASKDGSIGWLPLVTTDGKPQLENVSATGA